MDEVLRDLKRRVAAGEESLRPALTRTLLRAGLAIEEAWSGVPLQRGEDEGPELDDEEQRRFHDDLCHLDPARLLRYFPSLQRRTFALDSAVLLARYRTLDARRTLWLCVRSPKTRRRDEQVLTLRREVIYHSAAYPHRWHWARFFWDARTPLRSDLLWGSDAIDGGCVPNEAAERQRLLAELTPRLRTATATHADKLRATVLLQCADQARAALAIWNISLAPPLLAAVTEDNAWPAFSVSTDAMIACREALCTSAPWRWRAALSQRGDGRILPTRLLILPSNNSRLRKPTLIVTILDDQQLQLAIEYSASYRRLPEHLWKRPLVPGEALPKSKRLRLWYPWDDSSRQSNPNISHRGPHLS